MEKLNTMKLRKHPGGLRFWIRLFKVLFKLSIGYWVVLGFISLILMFSTNLALRVESKKTVAAPALISNVKSIKQTGTYYFEVRNVFDWLFFSRESNFLKTKRSPHGIWIPNLFDCVFMLLTIWYMFRIFRALELDNPFSFKIAKDIKTLGHVMLCGFIFDLIQGIYIHLTIQRSTNHLYKVIGGKTEFSLGIIVIILIIAEVYKRGCELQEDKNLTV